MKYLQNGFLILFVLAFAKAYSQQPLDVLMDGKKKPMSWTNTSWKQYDVSKMPKQIELVVYKVVNADSIVPLDAMAYVFNSDGNLEKSLEANQYLQTVKMFKYENGKLVSESDGSKFGITEQKYKRNEKGDFTEVPRYRLYYQNDKLSSVTDPAYPDRTDSYKHKGSAYTVYSKHDKRSYLYVSDQLVAVQNDDNDYATAYHIPFTNHEVFFNLKKTGKKWNDLFEMAANDPDAFNKFVDAQMSESEKEYPFSKTITNQMDDWTAIIYKPKHDQTVRRYYLRKIIYADGSTSGNTTLDKKTLQSIEK
ncbi:hypothetical protein BST97_05830 [Nonlabens spongiae]|uniref:Uncharacterized protein n=1 Tax=Nonlabens spongiae TaxID=331648 RepID=A0A1W6MIV0_9FLAO|nr:hypothetical protein [Nonlabens spongiae]ARN77544.1 hypothetical protein BST97_05830 [Nonlabens spongiae]